MADTCKGTKIAHMKSSMGIYLLQTRHPKSVVDGRSGPITGPAFPKATQVKITCNEILSANHQQNIAYILFDKSGQI